MKKNIIIGISISTAIFLLAAVSFFTTFGSWDGVILSAKFKLRIIDNLGKPVSGAKLSVIEKHGLIGTKKTISYDFPIQEFTDMSQPISDADGFIEISHMAEGGLETGGGSFALFWCIPVKFDHRSFIVKIETPNQKDLHFDYFDMYKNCDKKASHFSSDDPLNCQLEITI